ncbi:MAG: epoxyqueuosine reductase QueH [Candidatus Firestonebacteria bacterium]
MKKVMLHICCSICFLEPYKHLREEQFEIIGFFNNPNIQPYTEYLERLNALKNIVKINNTSLIVPNEYSIEEYHDSVVKVLDVQKLRCKECYNFRLTKTAQLSKANKIQYFSTTLLASPYQDINSILEVGHKISEEYKIEFIWSNKWLDNYYKSKEEIRKKELYIQKYCGCLYSKMERKFSEGEK